MVRMNATDKRPFDKLKRRMLVDGCRVESF
jgi:hypothetical protein